MTILSKYLAVLLSVWLTAKSVCWCQVSADEMEAMMRRLPPAARTQLYPIIQQIDEDGETPTCRALASG